MVTVWHGFLFSARIYNYYAENIVLIIILMVYTGVYSKGKKGVGCIFVDAPKF